MPITHVKSLTQADATATSIVRPSDWNTNHQWIQNIAGNTLGTSQVNGTDVVWAGGNYITLSANGSTISIHGGNPISRYYAAPGITAGPIVQANTQASINNFMLWQPLVASCFAFPASVSCATAANTSSAGKAVSISIVFYTRNASTLSSVFSGSLGFTASYNSNNTASINGVRELSATFAQTTLSQGRWYYALHISSATTSTGAVASWTNLGQSFTLAVVPSASAWNNIAPYNSTTVTSNGLDDGLGLFGSANTAATIGFNAISGLGNSGLAANQWFDIRNYTL